MKRILVAVDFSPASEQALHHALRLAGKFESRLLLLHVIHDPANAPGFYAAKKAGKKVLRNMEAAAAEMMAATRREPGNIEYVFSISVADPAHVQIFEVWQSGDDLEKHFTLPHMETFRATLGDITITGRDIR